MADFAHLQTRLEGPRLHREFGASRTRKWNTPIVVNHAVVPCSGSGRPHHLRAVARPVCEATRRLDVTMHDVIIATLRTLRHVHGDAASHATQSL